MNLNKDTRTYKPPFKVVLLDAMDAYYYADVMGSMEVITECDTYKQAIVIADAYFVVNNYGWKSLAAMNDLDAGYDVRVYDMTPSCVYAAHQKYEKKWIGE